MRHKRFLFVNITFEISITFTPLTAANVLKDHEKNQFCKKMTYNTIYLCNYVFNTHFIQQNKSRVHKSCQ